jgi:hypothetical protein
MHTYARGAWCGTLDEVKANIRQYGNINVCRFNSGYFESSLPNFDGKCVFIFLDVDLVSSLKTCLKYLWPQLQDGCPVFTHEAPHLEIASVFFDRSWWQSEVGEDAPGLVGAGSGLGLIYSHGTFRSDLGYSIKHAVMLKPEVQPQLGLEPRVKAGNSLSISRQ